jgi:hypothetical protein
VASAAEPPLSWTAGDASDGDPARVRVTVARTALGKVVVFSPQATQVELLGPLLQDIDLFAAPGPGVTLIAEKSLGE